VRATRATFLDLVEMGAELGLGDGSDLLGARGFGLIDTKIPQRRLIFPRWLRRRRRLSPTTPAAFPARLWCR
jgi:hypothetical protein